MMMVGIAAFLPVPRTVIGVVGCGCGWRTVPQCFSLDEFDVGRKGGGVSCGGEISVDGGG